MSEQDKYQKNFSDNLRYWMALKGIKQQDIINALGVPSATVSYWCSGERLPRMDKVQKLANFFGIKISDLLEERSVDLIQDELFEQKKILFSKANNASAEDLQKILEIVDLVIGDDKD